MASTSLIEVGGDMDELRHELAVAIGLHQTASEERDTLAGVVTMQADLIADLQTQLEQAEPIRVEMLNTDGAQFKDDAYHLLENYLMRETGQRNPLMIAVPELRDLAKHLGWGY